MNPENIILSNIAILSFTGLLLCISFDLHLYDLAENSGETTLAGVLYYGVCLFIGYRKN